MTETACHSQPMICAGDRCEAVQRLLGRWKLSRQMKDVQHQVEIICKSASYANSKARIVICCGVNSVYQVSLRLLSLRRILMLVTSFNRSTKEHCKRIPSWKLCKQMHPSLHHTQQYNLFKVWCVSPVTCHLVRRTLCLDSVILEDLGTIVCRKDENH
jgi:hypothetical protein